MNKNVVYRGESKTELLSGEINEFIQHQPHWIVRKGNNILLVFLVLLIGFSFFLNYPDVIIGSVRIVSVNSPKLVTAKSAGTLKKLLVENDQLVATGQHLAFLQSNANHEQVLSLYNWITDIEPYTLNNKLDIVLIRELPRRSELGEIQSVYQGFENAFIETKQLVKQGFYQQKMEDLQRELSYMKDIQNVTIRRMELLQDDLFMQEAEYKAKQSLEKDKIIAPLELNQGKAKLNEKKQAIEQLNSDLIYNKITINNKSKEMAELRKYITDQEQVFHTALLTLKSSVEDWMQHFIVSAATSGKLNYVGYLQENQYIQLNQDLFYIIPDAKQFYGELKVQQLGMGKIKVGQKVIVKVKSFPSEEFGYLAGKVSYIPPLVNGDSILIKVDFENGLKTNYKKELLFKDNMVASGEVITQNRKLVERLVGQIKDIISR